MLDHAAVGGPCADLIRATDWSATPLGPPSSWPDSLRTSLDICLASRFPILLWWGPELTMLYNDAYRPSLGSKHPASMGRAGREVWPEIWDVIGPMLDQAMAGEGTWAEDQLLLVDRAGFEEEAYFTFSYSPILGDDGSVAGIFTAVTETTEQVLRDRRLRVLGALRERARVTDRPDRVLEQALAVLSDNPADVPFTALYRVDDEQACLDAVGGIDESLLGVTTPLEESPWKLAGVLADGPRAVALPSSFADHVHASAGPPPTRGFVQPLRDPGTEAVSAVLVTGLAPRRPFDDEYRGFLELVADQLATGLADARAAELERRRLDALAELNRAKTQFFSNVSHEFRTPLTLLLRPLEDVLADPGLGEDHREHLDVVRRNADRLTKLVNTLLDFSRMEAGRAGASFVATDLADVSADLASVFRSAVESAGLSYDIDVEALPEPVYVDRDAWEKILFNLLSNALKYTFEGRIWVRLRDEGGQAALEVGDTGVGVPDDQRDRLFERFHRVRGARARSHEGTGIGLSLAQELAQLHGGAITLSSTEGAGSTFRVTIPYGTDHLPPEQVDAEQTGERTAIDASTYLDEALGWSGELPELASDEPTDPGDTAGAHLLVVDDNPDMRRYLVRVLGQHWRVNAAHDGEQALTAIRAQRPDLVLTDVMMPGLDGFELAQALRADPELGTIPVVMLSARASEAATVDGLDAGADDYLVKPFTNLELVARIRANLEMAKLRDRAAAERVRHEMLAGLSHDMQTPIGAILGFLGAVEQSGPEELAELAARVGRQGRRLRGLVRQFLDFSRLEGDVLPDIQAVALDPAAVATAAAELADDARVELDIAAGVPDAMGDPDRVEQILVNLCSNALKFSAADEPVCLRVHATEDAVVFEVIDRGAGIADDELEEVFTKFYRGRGHGGVSGTGLGLYIGRALAEAMGASLEVASKPDEGSTFCLRLPRA